MSKRGEFQDKVLTCADCRDEFTWNAGEQAFFIEEGLTNEPNHCKDCRRANKQHQGARNATKGQ